MTDRHAPQTPSPGHRHWELLGMIILKPQQPVSASAPGNPRRNGHVPPSLLCPRHHLRLLRKYRHTQQNQHFLPVSRRCGGHVSCGHFKRTTSFNTTMARVVVKTSVPSHYLNFFFCGANRSLRSTCSASIKSMIQY